MINVSGETSKFSVLSQIFVTNWNLNDEFGSNLKKKPFISVFFFSRWLVILDHFLDLMESSAISFVRSSEVLPEGGTQIIFWRGVRPEVWNPYPYLRIFLPQKMADLKLFFEIFANRDPFLRVFYLKMADFTIFFAIFAKWDPLLRIFLTKMGPMSKDFCWKSNPFGRHIPVCLNMWVPPGGIVGKYYFRIVEKRLNLWK